jgi:hypothetical protein
MAIIPAVKSFSGTVLALTVDKITFSGSGPGFRVANRGVVDLWANVTGIDPVAGADGSYLIQAGTVRYLRDPGTAHEIRLTAGAVACYMTYH